MQMIVGDDDVVRSPSSHDIQRAFAQASDERAFLVLEHSRTRFLQCVFCDGGLIVLEYREGPRQQVYRCTSDPLSPALAMRALVRYAAGEQAWGEGLTWEGVGMPGIPQVWDEPVTPAPLQPDPPLSFTAGHLHISRTWFFGTVGLLCWALALGLCCVSGRAATVLIGVGLVLLILAPRSAAEKRGYRF
ncbi:MAG: hypothetical protein WDZ31_05005 [Phycisphaeraceae bacterium]